MKLYNNLMIFPLFLLSLSLTACSDAAAEPSGSLIVECILDATDHPALGQERKNIVMGMEIGSTVIDHIAIDNVLQDGERQWIVYSVLTVGSKDIGATADDVATTAEMFGFQQKNGFLLQDVEVDYLFQEGNRGWSCFEI